MSNNLHGKSVSSVFLVNGIDLNVLHIVHTLGVLPVSRVIILMRGFLSFIILPYHSVYKGTSLNAYFDTGFLCRQPTRKQKTLKTISSFSFFILFFLILDISKPDFFCISYDLLLYL